MVHFCILGPLSLTINERTIRLRGRLQNKLLLTLLINAGQMVITDDIIGEVWPSEQPERVENALQAHVSRLRRRLAGLEPGTDRLVTHTSGYQLLVAPEELDAELFRQKVEHVRGDRDLPSTEAVRELRKVLEMWRGPVLGCGASGGPMHEAAKVRYEELHLSAIELLYDKEMASGNHAQVIQELHDLLAKYPFHERLRQQLMIALYRSGRQVEALAVYGQLSSRLSQELGLEPTPEMRRYERAIREGGAGLDAPSAVLG